VKKIEQYTYFLIILGKRERLEKNFERGGASRRKVSKNSTGMQHQLCHLSKSEETIVSEKMKEELKPCEERRGLRQPTIISLFRRCPVGNHKDLEENFPGGARGEAGGVISWEAVSKEDVFREEGSQERDGDPRGDERKKELKTLQCVSVSEGSSEEADGR